MKPTQAGTSVFDASALVEPQRTTIILQQPASAEASDTEVPAWVGSTSERRPLQPEVRWTPHPWEGRTRFVDRFNTLGKWKFHSLRETAPPRQIVVQHAIQLYNGSLSRGLHLTSVLGGCQFSRGMKFLFPEGVEAIYKLRPSFPRLGRPPNFRLEGTTLRRGAPPSWHLRIRFFRAGRLLWCCRSLGPRQPRVFFSGPNRRDKIGQLERLLQPVLMKSSFVLSLRPCFYRSPLPTIPMILIIGLLLTGADGRHFRFQLFHQSFGASDPFLRVPQYAILDSHLLGRFLHLTLKVTPLVLLFKDLPGLPLC